MTGYGKSVKEMPNRRITIEIRSVNSKQLDLNLRLPNIYREKELEIRSLIGAKLERGKVDVGLNVESTLGQINFTLDKALATNYYIELKTLGDALSLPETDYLAILARLPDVVKPVTEPLVEEDWKDVMATLEEALEKLDTFRIHEGQVLEKDFVQRIGMIKAKLKQAEPFEKQRIISLKERIRKNLREFMDSESYDENRLEQELFYYIEKLDITEEKIRLLKHCDHFIQTTSEEGFNGKKLGFITQEIGREINTLGSKANDADIQKLVVGMKDELEKIKEQLLNIL
jgi:uncharacterized protein (TIGR00255 family)